MKEYYNQQNFERKSISDETYNAWIEENNPKKDYWIPVPEQPNFDPNTQYVTWGIGGWIINDIQQQDENNI